MASHFLSTWGPYDPPIAEHGAAHWPLHKKI
jgi:hypothetical protein